MGNSLQALMFDMYFKIEKKQLSSQRGIRNLNNNACRTIYMCVSCVVCIYLLKH